jgi:kumamolisin
MIAVRPRSQSVEQQQRGILRSSHIRHNLGRRPLPGSAPLSRPGAARMLGRPEDEVLDVSIRLRASTEHEPSRAVLSLSAEKFGSSSLGNRRYLSRSEFREFHAASPADIESICTFAKEFSLSVTGTSGAGRSAKLRGAVSDIEKAFGTRLELYECPLGKYQGHEGELLLPTEVLPLVEGVFGLENLRQSQPFHSLGGNRFEAGSASAIEKIAAHYRFPSDLSGKGECIGILAFGGGIALSDLQRYFHKLHGTVPDLRFQGVTPANQPNLNSQHDRELALDIEIAGGLAPGARIVIYFATNDEKGWVDALSGAIHDDENKPSILSISWGAFEEWWGRNTIRVLTQLFEEAATLGITICAASGDDGCAMDGDGHCRVTFPASSPLVLACGGSSLLADDKEIVWNVRNKSASGGGISDVVTRPDWQSSPSALASPAPSRRNPNFDGRQLPDVAGAASTTFNVYVGGCYHNGAGGTSAVVPLWSALIARLNEGLKRRGLPGVGYFNPLLYKNRFIQNTFRDITVGHNDPYGRKGYEAQSGWDACTGWGTPNGEKLLETLGS